MYSSQPREPAFSPLAEPSSPDSFNGQSTRSELRSPIGRSKAEADSVVLVDEIQTEDPSAGRSALLPTVSPFEMDTNDGVDSSSNVRDARKRITDRSRALFAGLAVLVLVAVIVTTLLLRYSAKKHMTTILISFDGFRYDYLDRGLALPALARVREEGVCAQWMQPIFPSATFPNHYAIVTGLHAESHGIVANTMYDPLWREVFTLSNGGPSDGKWWSSGDPIWNTARRQGKTAYVMYWPGSEAEINGLRPNLWFSYNHSTPPNDRVSTVLAWLNSSSKPDLILSSFENVDTAGHMFGPDSLQVDQAAEVVDAALGSLLSGIEALGLEDTTNVIVVSDHGMTTIAAAKTIFIDDYIGNMSLVYCVDYSPNLAILPVEPWTSEDVFAALHGAHPNLTLYLKPDIPGRFHYQSHRRIAPVLGVADLGWTVTTHALFVDYNGTHGTHGFDNHLMQMQSIFLAIGPSFKKGFTIPPIVNRDVYPLICHLLGVEPSPNNGSFAAWLDVFTT